MIDRISDITVNISVEDVVNPAAFGTPLIFTHVDASKGNLSYTECYEMSEAVEALNKSTLKESMVMYNVSTISGLSAGDDIPKATLNVTSGDLRISFLANTYSVDSSSKTYGSYTFNKRIKAISNDNGCTITPLSGDRGRSIIVYGIASNNAKPVSLVLADSSGNIVGQQEVSGDDVNAVTFSIGAGSLSYTLYSTSTDNATVHIYGIELVSLDDVSKAIQRAVEVAFSQEPRPEKIAVLATSKEDFISNYLYYEWHVVTYLCDATSGSNQDILEYLSNQIEAAPVEKVLLFASTPSRMENSVYRAVLARIKSNERTFILLEDNASAVKVTSGYNYPFAAVALMAKTASKDVGSITYKNQQLKGVYPISNINKSTLNEWHSGNINCVVTKAGYDVTSEGKTLGGEFLDIIDCKDWLIMQIKYQLQQALIINDKIPYTNQGIDYLAAIVVNILNDAYNNGMINTTDDGLPDYSVNFKPRSETKSSDREKRQYVDGRFSFGLAGAIHTVTVNGTILI